MKRVRISITLTDYGNNKPISKISRLFPLDPNEMFSADAATEMMVGHFIRLRHLMYDRLTHSSASRDDNLFAFDNHSITVRCKYKDQCINYNFDAKKFMAGKDDTQDDNIEYLRIPTIFTFILAVDKNELVERIADGSIPLHYLSPKMVEVICNKSTNKEAVAKIRQNMKKDCKCGFSDAINKMLGV